MTDNRLEAPDIRLIDRWLGALDRLLGTDALTDTETSNSMQACSPQAGARTRQEERT